MSNQQDIIAEFLASHEQSFANEQEKNYKQEDFDTLEKACDSFLSKERFEVGQIVRWKKNLKNRKFPYQNQPAIVLEILEKPIISSEEDSGSPYFLEKLDIVLGIMSEDQTFLTFYYDSSRFESYQPNKR